MKLKIKSGVWPLILLLAIFSLLVIISNQPVQKKAESVDLHLQNKPFLVNTSPKQRIFTMLSLIDQKNERGKTEQASEEQKISEVPNRKTEQTVSRGGKLLATFNVTAYDLSIQSCGRSVSNEDYGKTASGINLRGKTWESARAISVDPKIIPLGTKIYLEFLEPKYQKYNGVYTAVDTGPAIKGFKLDFFIGDFHNNKPNPQTIDFGHTKAKVMLLD